MQLGLIRFQERKFRWLILSAMSGSAQTARSPTQRLICKTLYILAYAELLGSAALELRCRGCLRRSAVFHQVSASNALAVPNETLDSRAKVMGSMPPRRIWGRSWAWGRAPSQSRANSGACGKGTALEPAAATNWVGHPALSWRGDWFRVVSVVAVIAAALLQSFRLGVAPTA